jgi:hypothetical protein
MDNIIVYDGEFLKCGDIITPDLRDGETFIVLGMIDNKLKVKKVSHFKEERIKMDYPFKEIYTIGFTIGMDDCGGIPLPYTKERFKHFKLKVLSILTDKE